MSKNTGKYKAGDRVRLCKNPSVHWFTSVGMTITGKIETIDPEHMIGLHPAPFCIRFDDGRDGWYARDEIQRF